VPGVAKETNMSDRNVRSGQLAKSRPFKVNSKAETQLVEITSVATAGTFDADTSDGALLLKVNGTAVKIPFYTA
jgi:hypothetical protein